MKLSFHLLLVLSLLFFSCRKSEDHNSDGQVIVTGKNKLIVTVMHHTWAVPNVNVFLKNNATVFPGTDTAVYDWKKPSDNSGIAVFENLFEGNYFLYAEGFDQTWGAEVMGAAPAAINSSTITNNEVYVTLYVTE